jgi:hypothetical protein
MPKTATVKPLKHRVARVAPYLPLRKLTFRVDVCSPELRNQLVRAICRYGGVVANKTFDEVVTDDTESLTSTVQRRIRRQLVMPSCVKNVAQQVAELELYTTVEAMQPTMHIEHRHYTFPVRSPSFPPLTTRMQTPNRVAVDAKYSDTTIQDVIVIQYNRDGHAYDDTVVRLQLYKRYDEAFNEALKHNEALVPVAFVVHRTTTCLFHLCHNMFTSHYLREFGTQQQADAYFEAELLNMCSAQTGSTGTMLLQSQCEIKYF